MLIIFFIHFAFTTMLSTLVPAYGRDYKSKKEVLSDFLDNKDFFLQTYNSSGYINRKQVEQMSEKEVMIRYSKLMKVTVIKFSNKTQTWK